MRDLKSMRVVTPDRKKLAEKILTKEAGWDGMLPIPVRWVGTVEPEDLHGVTLLRAEGIFWVGDPVSALTLFLNGYNLEKDPEILAKRDTIQFK